MQLVRLPDWQARLAACLNARAGQPYRYGTTAVLTYNRHVATLGSFFAWAVKRRLVTEDPTDGLERRRKARHHQQQAGGQRKRQQGAAKGHGRSSGWAAGLGLR